MNNTTIIKQATVKITIESLGNDTYRAIRYKNGKMASSIILNSVHELSNFTNRSRGQSVRQERSRNLSIIKTRKITTQEIINQAEYDIMKKLANMIREGADVEKNILFTEDILNVRKYNNA